MREIFDHWAQKAKKEGYPARSVYKLKEIEEKFGVIPRQGRVLDLGAAPGSWSLFVLRLRGPDCRVVAADLAPLAIPAQPELVFYHGDIFAEATLLFLEGAGPYDTVLCDAAPATTGNRTVDASRSEALVEQALAIAGKTLRPGGACVVKIFQGGGEKRIRDEMKKAFASVKAFKPKATRGASFETYFIGQGKKPLGGA
ncbi:MAG: RlmE family RNA methyltransferase [Spirochaetaceae bacterium]|nr:RlmE family RNA methyltransferase [Spirochaetaceae bacterium]